MRIDRRVVDAHFIVHMIASHSRSSAGVSDVADNLPAGDRLTRRYGQPAHVPVQGCNAMAVVDGDFPAVAVDHLRDRDDSVGRRVNRGSERSGDVDSRVKLSFIAAENVLAFSKGRSDGAVYGPKRGCLVSRQPEVRSGPQAGEIVSGQEWILHAAEAGGSGEHARHIAVHGGRAQGVESVDRTKVAVVVQRGGCRLGIFQRSGRGCGDHNGSFGLNVRGVHAACAQSPKLGADLIGGQAVKCRDFSRE